MLNRLAGPEDLIALMTPDMAASDITFTRRTDKIADLIDRAGFWGQRNELVKKDPIDQMYQQCYPPRPARAGPTSVIAEEMIQRRREKATLDALEELVFYLGGLREERKGILLVSEGWLLFRPNRSLAEIGGTPQRPGVYVGPDGRIATSDPRQGRRHGQEPLRSGPPGAGGHRRRPPLPATSCAWPIDRTRASTR